MDHTLGLSAATTVTDALVDRDQATREPNDVTRELAALLGKNLGACATCGRPVFLAHEFTRARGRVAHLRCPITARTRVHRAASTRSAARARPQPA